VKDGCETIDIKMRPALAAGNLEDYFIRQKHIIVAYSGGVDSALLAFAAHRALGNQMVAVLADSPSLSRREYRSALGFAQNHGIPLRILRTREMEDPSYQANQADRCYHCKKALFERIETLREQLKGFDGNLSWPVCYGESRDDIGDYRPGVQAARDESIHEPYLELGFAKRTSRAICAYL